MRINWEDNPLLRVNLFERLKHYTGIYQYGVTSQNARQPHHTTKDMEMIFKHICVDLELPLDKWKALNQQVAWACTDQKEHPSYKATYNKCKGAAIVAGYMTVEDVVKLSTSKEL